MRDDIDDSRVFLACILRQFAADFHDGNLDSRWGARVIRMLERESEKSAAVSA